MDTVIGYQLFSVENSEQVNNKEGSNIATAIWNCLASFTPCLCGWLAQSPNKQCINFVFFRTKNATAGAIAAAGQSARSTIEFAPLVGK